MKQTKKIVKKTTKQENEEILKAFANFLKKSTAIMEHAIKETREKHPNIFKSP